MPDALTNPDGGSLTVFTEGDELFDSMFADMSGAQHRVWLESYIFEHDGVGRQFVRALVACAERGIDVRVSVDAVGSFFSLTGAVIKRLRSSGVKFRWCHPWQWRRPWAYHRRNHRKLLIVDDCAAYVGGFNISRLSSRRQFGMARWRDTHIRLSGPVVSEAASAHLAFMSGDMAWHGDETRGTHFLTNHARGCRFRLRCVLHERFDGARERIWLTTPYFVPDQTTQHRLCAAARRGVDVRVLVPGKSDVPIVQWASRAAYSLLLQAGVRLFEYQSRTLHAKTLLVDGDWSTVGTANFDYRSFFINYELNLLSTSDQLNALLAQVFERDLQASREIEARPWRARPLRGRLAELVGWSARHWL